MNFRRVAVPNTPDFPGDNREVLLHWQQHFQKSVKSAGKNFSAWKHVLNDSVVVENFVDVKRGSRIVSSENKAKRF